MLKAPKKKNEVVVGKESSAMSKSKNKLKKLARKREEEREKMRDDGVVEISMDEVLILPEGAGAPSAAEAKALGTDRETSKAGGMLGASIVPGGEDEDDDAMVEIEEQELALEMKVKGSTRENGGVRAFQQRDLVALAFAGDNVVQVTRFAFLPFSISQR